MTSLWSFAESLANLKREELFKVSWEQVRLRSSQIFDLYILFFDAFEINTDGEWSMLPLKPLSQFKLKHPLKDLHYTPGKFKKDPHSKMLNFKILF